MLILIACQLVLLIYHQVTTQIDFFPFNSVRRYTSKEKLQECGINGILMALPPIGFYFQISSLEVFGVFYYCVLFAMEMIIWWIPYFFMPSGYVLVLYNFFLAFATCDFKKGNVLARWEATYERHHQGTITLLPNRGDRVVPNLDHTILHVLTLFTAVVTVIFYSHLSF